MDRLEYAWRDGARLQKGARVAAQVVGARLEQLRIAGDGELTPEVVIADARHSASPLHSLFEWTTRRPPINIAWCRRAL